MTANKFGGVWTRDKLAVLGNYLTFYATAMKKQPYERVYIDAFAGTGRCKIRARDGSHMVIDGSAKIALDCSPSFAWYDFIENKRKYAKELAALIAEHPNGRRAKLHHSPATVKLPQVLGQYDWNRTRGVLFLDPFGLQCTWEMLQQIRATEALDVFFLVSVAGLFRQAAVNMDAIDEAKAASLTAFLGTEEWRTHLYTREQGDLFGKTEVTRARGWENIVSFVTSRLQSLFPYVGAPRFLPLDSGVPLFALYFAMSNPAPRARDLGSRVSREILRDLR